MDFERLLTEKLNTLLGKKKNHHRKLLANLTSDHTYGKYRALPPFPDRWPALQLSLLLVPKMKDKDYLNTIKF